MLGLECQTARQRKKSTLNMKAHLSIHSQVAEITRLVGVAFPTLANAEKRAMALEQHLLTVAPTTVKEAAQTTENYLAIGEPDQAPRVMPVKPVEPTSQASALKADIKTMAKAVAQQTVLLR